MIKLEKKGAILILVHLKVKRRINISFLLADLKERYGTGSSTFYSALAILENLGLVKEEILYREGRRNRIIELTNKGDLIAEKLMEINQILQL